MINSMNFTSLMISYQHKTRWPNTETVSAKSAACACLAVIKVFQCARIEAESMFDFG